MQTSVKKDFQRNASRRFTNNNESKAFLDSLANSGMGTWTARKTTKKGGRPTQVFVLKEAPTETVTPIPTHRERVTGNRKRQPLTAERWKKALAIGRANGMLPKPGAPRGAGE